MTGNTKSAVAGISQCTLTFSYETLEDETIINFVTHVTESVSDGHLGRGHTRERWFTG